MAAYRLNIFNFKNINLYSKILYLDTDILIINDINQIFNMSLENKLYAKMEWNTVFAEHGESLFKENNPNVDSFCSGVMFFNNCNEMRYLFNEIINHINKDIRENNLYNIPTGLEQPYVIFNAIKNNMYNNTSNINYYVNHYDNQSKQIDVNNIIMHFQGDCYSKSSKNEIMKYIFENFVSLNIYKKLYNFTNNNNNLINFKWKDSTIIFVDGKTCTIQNKQYTYEFYAKNLIKLYNDNESYLIKFDDDYNKFICIQNNFDLNVSSGIKI